MIGALVQTVVAVGAALLAALCFVRAVQVTPVDLGFLVFAVVFAGLALAALRVRSQ